MHFITPSSFLKLIWSSDYEQELLCLKLWNCPKDCRVYWGKTDTEAMSTPKHIVYSVSKITGYEEFSQKFYFSKLRIVIGADRK